MTASDRAVLLAIVLGLSSLSPLAAGAAAAQDRVFTGRIDVTGLPAKITAVVVKCRLLTRTTARGPLMAGEAETSIPTVAEDGGGKRATGSFTVTVRPTSPTALVPFSYACELGFRAVRGYQVAGHRTIFCRDYQCGDPSSVIRREGTLP